MKKALSIFVIIAFSLCIFAACGSSKTYVIVTDNNMNPFCHVNGSGEPIGFDIDILNAIAEDQNIRIEIRPVGLLDGFDALSKGDADGMIAALIPTDELMAEYDFSDTYYNNEYAFAVERGKNAQLLEKFNAGLANIIENGKYEEIYNNHFNYEGLL